MPIPIIATCCPGALNHVPPAYSSEFCDISGLVTVARRTDTAPQQGKCDVVYLFARHSDDYVTLARVVFEMSVGNAFASSRCPAKNYCVTRVWKRHVEKYCDLF